MESYRIIDNFLTDAEIVRVRDSAISAGFGTWAPACDSVLKINSFAGVGYMGDHATIYRALHKQLGFPVYPGEHKFRLTDKEAGLSYVHSDRGSGTMSCILYLSNDGDERSGTGFFRHRPTPEFARAIALEAPPLVADRMPCYKQQHGTIWGEMLQRDMKEENINETERWECTGFVRAVFNRMLVFNSALYHARLPREGLGEGAATGRLIWVAHTEV
jgi:hypothetical protein